MSLIILESGCHSILFEYATNVCIRRRRRSERERRREGRMSILSHLNIAKKILFPAPSPAHYQYDSFADSMFWLPKTEKLAGPIPCLWLPYRRYACTPNEWGVKRYPSTYIYVRTHYGAVRKCQCEGIDETKGLCPCFPHSLLPQSCFLNVDIYSYTYTYTRMCSIDLSLARVLPLPQSGCPDHLQSR